MKKIILFALLLAISACNYIEPSISQQPGIYLDTPIKLSELMVYVQPTARQHMPMRALVYPMWIQQNYPERLALGRAFTKVFHNAWTEEQLFPAQVLADSEFALKPDRAIAKARKQGADVVILFTVPYLYTGHTLDDTAVTVQMDMYETTAGHLIYSMQQASRIEFKAEEDWILFAKKYRMPTDPLLGCLWAIAKDMAVPLKSWLPPYNPRDLGFASTRSEIIDGLTSGKNGPYDPNADVIAQGGAIYLRIEFDVDKATIRPEFNNQLDELGRALTSSALRDKKVILGGHTDSDASAEYNLDLSKRRAEAVKGYLVRNFQIDPGLIGTKGYGESRPIMPNDNTANKQLNRRVEVRLAD
ncbi:MAG: OmpA family protein [Proteobacteria bacterium]|nr:OmpA family protein [Pseudomonadota bacterium]MBU1612754.1 OmpA family protein [Pseudomonadota bacterium]